MNSGTRSASALLGAESRNRRRCDTIHMEKTTTRTIRFAGRDVNLSFNVLSKFRKRDFPNSSMPTTISERGPRERPPLSKSSCTSSGTVWPRKWSYDPPRPSRTTPSPNSWKAASRGAFARDASFREEESLQGKRKGIPRTTALHDRLGGFSGTERTKPGSVRD